MPPELQTVIALALVALAAGWLIGRAVVRHRNPGCGSDCGCATRDIKAKLKSGSERG